MNLPPVRIGLAATVLSVLILFAASIAMGQAFSTERVVSGLSRPVALTSPPNDVARLFVAEQHSGRIRIIDLASRAVLPTPFLTISGISTGNEQGLLGLAFHPDFATNGFFYVYLTDPATRVLRYQVSSSDPNQANPASELDVLSVSQPQPNHNGGWMGFGPDGYLYVATGDGGNFDDTGTGHTPGTGNSQDITSNLLGKILRIDVNTDDFPADATRNYAIPIDNPFVGNPGDDEIWAYGLRNPFRSSFDRATGDLYIGDVGQDLCEEINFQPAASTGGENYGWRLREGVIQNPSSGIGGPAPAGAIDPIIDYPHAPSFEACSGPPGGLNGFSVTGGFVYRGPAESLRGRYFFADFGVDDLWSLRFDGSPTSAFDGTNYTDLVNHGSDPNFTPDEGAIRNVSSFGEDGQGNLYVTDLFDGEVFIVPEPTAGLLPGGLFLIGLAGKRRRRRIVVRANRARTSGAPSALRLRLRLRSWSKLKSKAGSFVLVGFLMAAWGASAPLVASAQVSAVDTFVMTEAEIEIHFKTGLLEELGIDLLGAAGQADPVEAGLRGYKSSLRGRLTVELPGGSFEGFASGQLTGGRGPTLRVSDMDADFGDFSLEPSADPRRLLIRGDDGMVLAQADHIHVHHVPQTRLLELKNADLRITRELAVHLGVPRLEGIAIGLLELTSHGVAPTEGLSAARAETVVAPSSSASAGPAGGPGGGGGGQCSTPNFTLPIDVALIEIGFLQQSAREGGFVAVTPSAELQNVGQGDVAWEEALDPDHPMLAWALYRKQGDVFEQIGVSATKHAFFSTNENCPCPGGNILWAGGCTDIYGVFTNEDRTNLGPREEITAASTSWDACGSLFDAGCDGFRDFPTPADSLERRMAVAEADLLVPGAEYFIEAWYLVADDINIFNTMGYRPVTPSFGGGFFSFSLGAALAEGPAIDAWVPRGTLAPDQSAQVVTTNDGQFEVAGKVVEISPGSYRYEYAIMNFDFDPMLRSFEIPVEPGVTITSVSFSDATQSASDDWTASVSANAVTWTAPASQGVDWGRMLRLGFVANTPSILATGTLQANEATNPSSFGTAVPAPVPEPGFSLILLSGIMVLTRLGLRRRLERVD